MSTSAVYLHEARVVHAVADPGGWIQLADSGQTPSTPVSKNPAQTMSMKTDDASASSALAGWSLEQASEPAKSETNLTDRNAPDPAKVAAARERGLARLPTMPSEIKAAVDARLGVKPAPTPIADLADMPVAIASDPQPDLSAAAAKGEVAGQGTHTDPAEMPPTANAPTSFPEGGVVAMAHDAGLWDRFLTMALAMPRIPKASGVVLGAPMLANWLPYRSSYDARARMFINTESIGFMLELAPMMGADEQQRRDPDPVPLRRRAVGLRDPAHPLAKPVASANTSPTGSCRAWSPRASMAAQRCTARAGCGGGPGCPSRRTHPFSCAITRVILSAWALRCAAADRRGHARIGARQPVGTLQALSIPRATWRRSS